MSRGVPNAPPPTADTNNHVPATLAAAAGKAWRALLHSMTALPRFGATEYQCSQYRRTGHYDALAEVTRCLSFSFRSSCVPRFLLLLVPFIRLFLVLLLTCTCLFKRLCIVLVARARCTRTGWC